MDTKGLLQSLPIHEESPNFSLLYGIFCFFPLITTTLNRTKWPGMVAHACNASTQEAEIVQLQVQGQTGLHSETLSANKQINNRIKLNKHKNQVNKTHCISWCLYALD
jgi:hypothetical protein